MVIEPTALTFPRFFTAPLATVSWPALIAGTALKMGMRSTNGAAMVTGVLLTANAKGLPDLPAVTEPRRK